MEELLELRGYIEQHNYLEALQLIGEMEEMSREDKVNKVRSFAKVLLLHLIKEAAEKRLTRSWQLSILNALSEIYYTNHRRKKGTYLDELALREVLEEAYPIALKRAALESFGGSYTAQAIADMVDRPLIIEQALQRITTFDPKI